MVFRDKTLKIANEAGISCCERGLASMVYKLFDQKTRIYGVKIKLV